VSETTTPPTTVFLGDSLTAEGNWTEWFPERRVVNLGVSGDTTELVLERLGAVIDEKPAVVVVMIGTNDLAWRRSVEQIVGGVESILWQLHHDLPNARILVQSVLPRAEDYTARIKDINIHLRQFAPTVKAEWVDLWPAFADDSDELRIDLSPDRLHLNEEGYREWRRVLGEVLDGGADDGEDDVATPAATVDREKAPDFQV
jgi:lysophospholipase L1-like esterase